MRASFVQRAWPYEPLREHPERVGRIPFSAVRVLQEKRASQAGGWVSPNLEAYAPTPYPVRKPQCPRNRGRSHPRNFGIHFFGGRSNPFRRPTLQNRFVLHRPLRILGLLLTSSLVAVIAGELVYRGVRTGRLGPTTNPTYVVHDAEFGWGYRAGAQVRHRSAEFDVAVTINAEGFRDRKWPERDPERQLLLVLGDSFAFGWGVEETERVSSILRVALPEWDVRNAAVSGYGTDQQLLLLRKLQKDLQPDAVLLMFCPNDLDESASAVAYGHRKPWFELQIDGALSLHGQPVQQPWIERVSHLAQAIHKQITERTSAGRPYDSAAQWSLVRALLTQMASMDRDSPLLLLSETHELAAFAQGQVGVHHVDPTQALQALGSRAFFSVDGHWTAAAHAAVAETLLPVLQGL